MNCCSGESVREETLVDLCQSAFSSLIHLLTKMTESGAVLGVTPEDFLVLVILGILLTLYYISNRPPPEAKITVTQKKKDN